MERPKHDIGAVVVSNSDDFVFLWPGLQQLAGVCSEVVVAVGTHLWNGEPEDGQKVQAFVAKAGAQWPNVRFVMYSVPQDEFKSTRGMVSPEMYWEGHARFVAQVAFKAKHEYVLFLDSDEVLDGSAFAAWLDTGIYKEWAAMKLQNYWYWREPTLRARGYVEDSAVMIRTTAYNPMSLFSNQGRHGVWDACTGRKARNLPGVDGIPMIHHFSWVRTKEGMLRKVRAWGHRNDRHDWEALVSEEFSRPFNGTDFLKRLQYDHVSNTYDITLAEGT